MSTQKAKAFVLRYYPYGEADRIVHFFTEELGLVKGIAKGSRKLKSRIAGALEPMTLVDLRFAEKAGRELVVVTGCDAVRSLFRAAADIEVAAVAGVIVELTAEFNADRDPNTAQFRLLDLAQKSLLAGISPQFILHYFEIFTLKLAGVLPPAEKLPHKGAQALMRTLLRTNILEQPLPDYKTDDLKQMGIFLRRNITRALGKRPKCYIFLEKVKPFEPTEKARDG